MSLSYKTLYQKVLLRLNDSSGRGMLAAKEAINNSHRYIARAKDFDELMILDTANAATSANQKTYDMANDWGLTRPKDILSIRYMDENQSRKLQWVSPRVLDDVQPYPEGMGTTRPNWYTQRGEAVELIPIPAANANLNVYHTQWPSTLANDADTSSFDDEMEDVIVALGTEIAESIIEGGGISDWVQRARELLGIAIKDEITNPDRTYVARPFRSRQRERIRGEYWTDPFVRRSP